MKKALLFFTLIIPFFGSLQAQNFETFDAFEDLEKELIRENDTCYVVNFWATWCAPCVKELPYFESLNETYKDQKVKVILVSLDFSKQIEKQFIPFLEKKKLQSKVVLLTDTNYNNWLPKIDNDWSGAIPATWLIQGKNRLFVEQDFEDKEALETFINEFIKPKN